MKNEHTPHYRPTIGLEIHVELQTKSKMFCGCPNLEGETEPNTAICPICMGHPGTLPVVNQSAVEAVLRVGLAVGGMCATYTEFDRKNYFYPDIPKGYQISQYKYPLVTGGEIAGVSITRIHLEEDTARSLHDRGDSSLLDFNRAGVPLMELVTDPVIHDAETAGAFARELQLVLRTLGVSHANMEEGHMRVEANISIAREGDPFGTKVEVKNLNSFRSVEGAILYETARQAEVLDGGGVVVQETRGWDEKQQKTFSQRKKESSHDYRYFPDPDIPKIQLDLTDFISRLKEDIPELPEQKRLKYENLGIPRKDVLVIVQDIDASKFLDRMLEEVAEKEIVLLGVNYLVSDIFALLISQKDLSLSMGNVTGFMRLMTLVQEGSITSRVAKNLLEEVVFGNQQPDILVEERGLLMKDGGDVDQFIEKTIIENEKVVAEYKAGKETALQYLVGQVMRMTRGSANPISVAQKLKERIK